MVASHAGVFRGAPLKKPAWEATRGGGVVLRISSDGDDRRIFLALKSAILGFF